MITELLRANAEIRTLYATTKFFIEAMKKKNDSDCNHLISAAMDELATITRVTLLKEFNFNINTEYDYFEFMEKIESNLDDFSNEDDLSKTDSKINVLFTNKLAKIVEKSTMDFLEGYNVESYPQFCITAKNSIEEERLDFLKQIFISNNNSLRNLINTYKGLQ